MSRFRQSRLLSATARHMIWFSPTGGEGRFLPAILQVRIPVDGVEDGDGLRDQRLGMKRHRRYWPVVMALRLRWVRQGDGMLGGDIGHAQDILQARREDPHD